MIRVTDSRLSLQNIESVSITLRSTEARREWDMLFASVECIQPKVAG